MSKLNPRIRREHIDQGKRASNDLCPLALAALEAGAVKVSVVPDTIRWTDRDGNEWVADLPKSAKSFMRTFDTTTDPICSRPFEFSVIGTAG